MMRGALPKRAAGRIAARSIIMLVGLRPVLFVATNWASLDNILREMRRADGNK
jgi:hypothetical protein